MTTPRKTMTDPYKCGRCGLPVSPGVCAPQPHVFHDRPEQCVADLVVEVARLRQADRAVARIGRCESPRGLVDPSAEPEAIGLRRVERSRPWGVWSSRDWSWVMREEVAAFETEDEASAYAETYDDTKDSFRALRFHEPEKKR